MQKHAGQKHGLIMVLAHMLGEADINRSGCGLLRRVVSTPPSGQLATQSPTSNRRDNNQCGFHDCESANG